MQTAERRIFLKGAIATTIMATTIRPTLARAKRPFFQRIGRPIGLQLYTLGEEAGRDLDATFAQVAKIGYRDIEMPSLYGKTAAEVRAAADRAGVTISGLHLALVPFGPGQGISLAHPPAQIADALQTLGVRFAGPSIALFPQGFRPDPAADIQAAIGHAFATAGADPWKRTATMLNERAAVLKPLGVSLNYHNHNLEFAPIAGGGSGWEILLAELDPALVGFEIDVGWVAAAGRDPLEVIGSAKGRVKQLHVKDVAAGTPINFALSMKPAELGTGTLDWARILPAAQAAGVEHYYVEQEPPFAIPRLEAVQHNFAYLSALRA